VTTSPTRGELPPPPTATNLGGYEIHEPVDEGARTIAYRGVRLGDRAPVVLKFLRAEYPTPDQIARLRNEYEITQLIDHPFVARALEFSQQNQRHYLVFDEYPGVPLHALPRADPPNLQSTLSLFLQILEGLGAIHQEGIVHKDLNPGNILVAPDRSSVKIIDFGIASRVGRETQDVVAPNALEGTLGYIAPEQTGRINRPVDYRSDFYSLGAILFEVLMGTPVFEARDPLELVYDHIARRPQIPPDRRAQIPESLCAIVLKLLAKTPEERYQSTGGLSADLRRCLQELQHLGRISVFTPGENDASDRFQLPHRLYGRQRETEIILGSFDRTSAGEKRVVLVSGPSGIGKSALVQEVQKPIAATRGFFVAGKCEALNRNIPYAAFTQAFRDLIRQLESESAESLARWRQSILEAVGPNAQVIIDIVPELESIIGPQPAVPTLDPEESQIRFNATFRRFVRLFCRFGQPFVLFFDDVQWIDAAGLRLLRAILLDGLISNLLFVWSFRDDEVAGNQPMSRLVDEVKQVGVPVDQIKVSPLGKADVHQLISDGLRGRHQDLAALASIVCERCDGNPFFVNQYLDHLSREGVIRFVHGLGSWTWDPARLGEGRVTDGIADLMRAKILKAPQAARETLQIAACIGSSFDLRMLSIVSEKSRAVLAAELQSALAEGFVTLVGASYRLFEASLPEAHVAFRFVHDRVQQSVHDMLADDARKRVHLRIARLLIQRAHEAHGEGNDYLFEIVDHLNQAWDLITDTAERAQAVTLNLRAGIRAKANVAYDVAARSLRHAMANLPPRAWKDQYAETSQLFLECADCEYLSGNFDVAEQLLDEASIHLRTNVERAAVYDIKIPMRTNRGRPAEAIRLGIEALGLFDIELSAKPPPAVVTEAIIETRQRLGDLSTEQLLRLPRMADREKLAIMRVFNRLGPPAYFTDQGLYALMHCLVIELTLQYGHASESVRGYSVYGMILGWEFGSFEEGARYGELAISLSDELGNVQM
jgi:predicted ATPase